MKKKTTIQEIRRDLLLKSLPHVPFDGWTRDVFNQACRETTYSKDMLETAFPEGIEDLVVEFARLMDEHMLSRLAKIDISNMRVRDKIKLGVKTRLDILEEYKEVERMAISFWALPTHVQAGLKSLWQTADVIWTFAGDTSSDYNHYTKRVLLSGVLSKTILYWLDDHSPDYQETEAFLERQINRVLSMGKFFGRTKGFIDKIVRKTKFSS